MTRKLVEPSPARIVTFVKCQGCTFLAQCNTRDWHCVLQCGECPRMAFDRRLEEDKLKRKRRYYQKPLL